MPVILHRDGAVTSNLPQRERRVLPSHAEKGTGSESAPLHLGVWLDYGFTLDPAQGIGVFVHNLLAGLVELDAPLQITLLVHPRDPDHYGELADRSGGRIRIVPEPWGGRHPPWWVRPIRCWLWCSERWHAWTKRCRRAWRKRRAEVRTRLEDKLRDLLARGRVRDLRAIAWLAVIALALPVALGLAWLGYGIVQLLLAVARALLFPVDLLDRLLRRVAWQPYNPEQTARDVGCDVWLIPWVNLNRPLPPRSIVMIHDLVHLHYPESLSDARLVEQLNHAVPQRAAEAAVVGCMSSFIRDHDLVGMLALDPAKVRVFPLAPPEHLPELDEAAARGRLPRRIRRPFLFYPAGFRPYKNHGLLIDALHLLHTEHGIPDLDLVFTGYTDLPADLQERVEQLGLQDHVHVLKEVNPRVLSALYRQATATLCPSLYEQGSFPIFEALSARCPVACSHIPPFVEQCRTMGEAMLYFDPHDPASAAAAVREIVRNRELVRERQWRASETLRRQTWRDVARQWL